MFRNRVKTTIILYVQFQKKTYINVIVVGICYAYEVEKEQSTYNQ
jgi:hypothetical protein